MRPRSLRLLGVLFFGCAASAGFRAFGAETVTIQFQDLLPYVGVSGHAGTVDFANFGAGVYQFDLSAASSLPLALQLNEPLNLFCTELQQAAPLDPAVYQITAASAADRDAGSTGLGANIPATGIGATRARNLQLLYGKVFGANYDPLGRLDTDAKRTGFQLAVWELSHDDDLTLVGVAGDPHFFVTAGDAAAIAQAQSWVDAVAASITAGDFSGQMILGALHHDELQDYLIPLANGSVVPEPATAAALFAVGAAGYAVLRRRRSQAPCNS